MPFPSSSEDREREREENWHHSLVQREKMKLDALPALSARAEASSRPLRAEKYEGEENGRQVHAPVCVCVCGRRDSLTTIMLI